MFTFGNLARGHRRHHRMHHYGYNRAEVSTSKKTAMTEAAIAKFTAIGVAGVAGVIGAYKGLPEATGVPFGFGGSDFILGSLLGLGEFYMLWKGGSSGKAIALTGGASTGLLCHWAAVQGTVYGAAKARQEGATGGTSMNGWNYDQMDSGASVGALPQQRVPSNVATGASFDPHYGMI